MKHILFLLLLILFAGCSDVLDKANLSAVPEEVVWNDAGYATAYVNKLYRDNLPSWNISVAGDSDEANSTSGILYGQLTSSSIDIWYYNQIRSINIFLDNIDLGTIEEATRKSLKAQVYVLRAWRYFEMVRVYGGVPIIDKAQSLSDNLYVKRNKTSECIDFIINDLENAVTGLPWQWTNNDIGRFTKATALALKARVLLYYASPQFNPDNLRERWDAAYNANKSAVDELSKNGYGLYDSYENIWFDEMNKEVIFVQRYEEPGLYHYWDAATRPLAESQNISGCNIPSLEMVESYPMINGKGIHDPESGYDPVIYWENRDPRFKTTIAYNGCLWELSGKTGRKQWTYVGAEVQPSASGFYCRKAINTSYTPYFAERSSTDWIELRYAEVLLNYAECAAESGKTEEAYGVLKEIRKRAGILPGNDGMYGLATGMNSGELVKAVLFERKIEFAYEGKRYWDLRRRRLFAEELNGKKRHGVQPILKIDKEEFLKIENVVNLDKDYGTYFRDSIVELDKVFSIDFKDNYYFYALPEKHLQTNSNLQQTQGWDNGTFNPYE